VLPPHLLKSFFASCEICLNILIAHHQQFIKGQINFQKDWDLWILANDLLCFDKLSCTELFSLQKKWRLKTNNTVCKTRRLSCGTMEVFTKQKFLFKRLVSYLLVLHFVKTQTYRFFWFFILSKKARNNFRGRVVERKSSLGKWSWTLGEVSQS
jgi:hypothetical protein